MAITKYFHSFRDALAYVRGKDKECTAIREVKPEKPKKATKGKKKEGK